MPSRSYLSAKRVSKNLIKIGVEDENLQVTIDTFLGKLMADRALVKESFQKLFFSPLFMLSELSHIKKSSLLAYIMVT